MPQAPLFAYLGIDEEGKPQLCVSIMPLNPWGDRVVKGRSPPSVIGQYLKGERENSDLAIEVLRAAARYLRDEEFGLDTPVFGDEVTPARKKRKKKPPIDVKVVS